MLRSIIRNSSAFGAAFIADRAVTFVFLAYAARKLGPELFGQYLLVGAYVMFVRMVFAAGVQPVAIRELVWQRDRALSVFEAVLSLRVMMGLVAYPTLLVIVWLVLPADVFLPLMAIAGSALIIDAYKDAFAVYHTAFNQVAVTSSLQVVNSVGIALAGTAVLYLDYGVAVLFASGAVVNLLVTEGWRYWFRRKVHRYRVRLAFSTWKELLKKILPFAPMVLAVQFNRLSSVILLSLVPGPVSRERMVGFFGPAQQLANFPTGLIFSVRRALVPAVAGKIKRGASVHEEFAVALLVATIFFSFPLVAATSLYPETLLWIAFGAKYTAAAPNLQLLGVTAALWIMASLPEAFLLASPQHSIARLLPGAYVPLLINIGLCVWLIPEFGAGGAAVAILAARAVYLGFVLHYCSRMLPIAQLQVGRFLRPALILAGTYGCGWLIKSSALPFVVGLAAAIAVTLAGMVWAGRAELTLLWNRRRPRGG